MTMNNLTSRLLLPLLCTQLCNSFVIPTPNRPTVLSRSLVVTFDAKENERLDRQEKFEWDGIVIEGAHDDEFGSIDDASDFIPSASFLGMASSVASPTSMAAAVGSTEFDPLKNMGKLHRMELEKSDRGVVLTAGDLEEMGGDPAFLDDFAETGTKDDVETFEWDGIVIEGAHDDDFGSIDDASDFIPSASFMSMASSVTSPVLLAAASGSEKFDPLKNMGKLHRMELEKSDRGVVTSADDLEEMGGDPAFLDGFAGMETKDDAAFFSKENDQWDGVVIEDAHDDDFDSVDDASDFIPSASFMSMASSVTSPAFLAATTGSEKFDPLKNMGKVHRMELEKSEGGVVLSADDLEEMGGDPAFLDDVVEVEPKDDAALFWDGEVDEEAHLD